MFIIRPCKEVPQMVGMVALVASPSQPVVFLSSLLWITPASPKHMSLLKPMTTNTHAYRMLDTWHGIHGSS
jgi:hypothetical protein